MQPWKRGSSAAITEPESETGIGLRAHRELEHLVRRLLDVEGRAVLVGDQEGEVAAEQLHLRPAEHLRGGEVDALDQAVR
jgi:hypothetical protein